MSFTKENTAVLAAVIALVGTVAVALVTYHQTFTIEQLDQEFSRYQQSTTFSRDKLTNFYQPMTMYLAVTEGLYARYLQANDDSEKTEIEHSMRLYNSRIRELLSTQTHFLEPDAPEPVWKDLLKHLVQWDIVYQLKYKYKTYDGYVFAGIKQFGFIGFPKKVEGYESVDDYYEKTTRKLRAKLHKRLSKDNGA
jgi:hypothetical protein